MQCELFQFRGSREATDLRIAVVEIWESIRFELMCIFLNYVRTLAEPAVRTKQVIMFIAFTHWYLGTSLHQCEAISKSSEYTYDPVSSASKPCSIMTKVDLSGDFDLRITK